MLIFVSVNTYVSFQKMRIENAYDAYGAYNIVLHGVNGDAYNWVRKAYGAKAGIGVEETGGKTESGITIIECDDNAIDMNGYKLAQGEFPDEPGEAAVSATAKYQGDYIVSQYGVGDRIELNSNHYTISGIIDDYDYSTVETYKIAVVADGVNSDIYNIYMHFYDKEDYQNACTEIPDSLNLEKTDIFQGEKESGFLSEYKMILNSELNAIEIEGEGSIQDIYIGNLLICFVCILILTSLMLGIHVFLSYYSDRYKQRGILMVLGFSHDYITFAYFLESLILTLTGCMAGILLGRSFTTILFHGILQLRATRLENFEPQFTKYSFIIVFVVSSIIFMLGVLPAISCNNNRSILDILNGKKNEYKQERKKTKEYKTKFVVMKYFLKDTYVHEKLLIYGSLVLTGMTFMLLLQVNQYIDYRVSQQERYSSQFELLSDDVSEMDGFRDMLPQVEYYDMIYDTMAQFYIDKDNVNDKYYDKILYEDNTVYCEIVGVSELQYNNKIELSNEVSYEEFVRSGGAIMIDNYLNDDEQILKELPSVIKYVGRDDEAVCFQEGEIAIMGRSRFLNWSEQRGISIIVPASMFKEKFDYTNVLIKVNVKDGHEIEAAELLNRYSYPYHYTFLDHATQYIKEHDDILTIRVCAYGMLFFITAMNGMTIIYINLLIYIRRRKNISILKVLGHSDTYILAPVIADVFIKSLVSTIVAVFTIMVLERSLLPITTQNIILINGWKILLDIFCFILLVHVIVIIMMVIKINKQRIIQDFGLQ